MSMIQVRNVPEDLHRRLKARAAMRGISLSDLVLREMEAYDKRPTMEEIKARLDALPRVKLSISPAEVIRAERDSR